MYNHLNWLAVQSHVVYSFFMVMVCLYMVYDITTENVLFNDLSLQIVFPQVERKSDW